MEDEKDVFSSVHPSRRSFLKKMVAFAFVAPVISSFGLDSLASASAHGMPNQTHGYHNEHDDHDDKDDKGDNDKD